MRYLIAILIIIKSLGCSNSKVQHKEFQAREISENEGAGKHLGLPVDSIDFETKPRNVLLTQNPIHRLTPIYKVNYDVRSRKPFTGSNNFHPDYSEYGECEGNNWNNNFMPGFEAVYGYNFVNISYYNNESSSFYLPVHTIKQELFHCNQSLYF